MNLEQLIDIFQNEPNENKRRQAVEDIVANNMYTNLSIKAFANGLLDNNVGIRDVCQRALLNTPDEYKMDTAIAVAPLINISEIELRNASGEILTNMGKYAVKTLLPYLKNNDFDVRKFACDILGIIGDESIVNNVTPLLTDPDKNTMLSAIETLGNLQAISALDSLIMVYESSEDVKPFVIEAIGKIGGENSESYLLEQLEMDNNDTFLQTTIIDALAYNAKNINISYKLLKSMPNCKLELQKIMMMTAFAIASRLDMQLVMPDDLRFVSHIGLKENDSNIMTASLLALGNEYRENDIDALMYVVVKNIPNLNKQIIYNLSVNCSVEIIQSFLGLYLSRDYDTEPECDFIVYINLFWEEVPYSNKIAIIDAVLFSIEQNYYTKLLDVLELIYILDNALVKEKLYAYSKETSKENQEIVMSFLNNHL